MLKKFQILLSYLALLVILLHGIIPHHHNEEATDNECVSFVHVDTEHPCNITSHTHNKAFDIVCHFKVVTTNTSPDNIFITEQQLHFIAEPETVKPLFEHPVLYKNNKYNSVQSLRAPPSIA